MNQRRLLLFLSISLLPFAAQAKKADAVFPVVYAGGSLPFQQSKVRAAIGNDAVIFTQGIRSVAVPLNKITDISCGTAVRRRMGASVLSVVPIVHLAAAENYYIGVSWTGADGAARSQVLLKLGRAEYREFLSALEQSTGMKAVDTNQVPTVVHYRI